MSSFSFISSDYPLEDVKNPHIRLLSVNEALDEGIEVPEIVMSSDIDRDKPNVLLWIDNEENLGEITIRALDKQSYPDCYAGLKFCSALEWNYSEERAVQLIAYLREHLKVSDRIELWHIWLGDDYVTPKKSRFHINDLTPAEIRKMFMRDSYEFPECMVIAGD